MSAPRLADELFLIGHDGHTGRPVGQADVLANGLAGALLGELLLDGRLTVVDGRVRVQDPRTYGDKASDAVLAEVRRQSDDRAVRGWVEYLRDEVRDVVGRRLVAAGVVRKEQARAPLTRRTQTRYPAADLVAFARPRTRLAHVLTRQEPVDAQLATLAALVRATGLDHVVADTGRVAVRDRRARIADNLPPVLRALVSGVDASVAAMALGAVGG